MIRRPPTTPRFPNTTHFRSLGPFERAVEPVVRADVGLLAVAPHLLHDLQRLLEPLEALGGGRERQPEPAGLVAVPRGPDPEHRAPARSEEHTSELQSRQYLVCRLLLEKKKHK